MHSTLVFALLVLAQLACGYVFPRAIQGFPPVKSSGVAFGTGLFKRQCQEGNACGAGCSPGPCCDPKLGLGCREGEYCTIVNNQLGCCPLGQICTSIRQCTSADTPGCENGGTVNGRLCCDPATPFCNSQGNIQFCQANPLPSIQSTKTIESTTSQLTSTTQSATESTSTTPKSTTTFQSNTIQSATSRPTTTPQSSTGYPTTSTTASTATSTAELTRTTTIFITTRICPPVSSTATASTSPIQTFQPNKTRTLTFSSPTTTPPSPPPPAIGLANVHTFGSLTLVGCLVIGILGIVLG